MKGILITLAVAVAAVSCTKQCPSDQSTNWELELLLPHEDCDKFYKCTYGEPVPQSCPTGLVYNIETQQCDWKNEVDCGDRNDPTKEDSDEVSQPEKPEPESESQEGSGTEQPEIESEEIVTEQPENESEEPQQPESESEEVKPEEGSKESESDESSQSESESNESETGSGSGEANKPESEESTPESIPELLENGCPVSPHIHWLLPSDVDCNQFYYCVFGEKKPRQCHSSLHFNPVLQVCDFPWDAGCQLKFNKRVPVRPLVQSF